MALTDTTFGSPGKDFEGTDRDELFLKIFGGEVLTAMNNAVIAKDKIRQRNITSGKSASFPLIGTHTAAFHAPGQDILADGFDGNIDHSEKVIAVDHLLLSHTMIDDLEEAMLHYDVRAPYAQQMGQALAEQVDETIFATVAAGVVGRESVADLSSAPDGKIAVVASIGDTSANVFAGGLSVQELLGGIKELALQFDKNNAPRVGRCLILRPEEFYVLLDSDNTNVIVNRDYAAANVGALENSAASLRVYGFDVYMSNIFADKVADTNYAQATAGAGRGVYRTGDFTNLWGLGFLPDAAGMVTMKNVAVERDYQIRYQANLMVAKQACGIDLLRLGSCGALVGSDSALLS